jgi:hypothetical protein
MKNALLQLGIALPKIQKYHIQLFLVLLTLALLVLGAGAPVYSGDGMH